MRICCSRFISYSGMQVHEMDRIIMWILAFGALAGGMDCIFGNRFGLGKKFEEGFRFLGPTALSMTGILCLVPLITRLLSGIVSALCTPLGIDPAMAGGLLAVDMGGYQLARELALDMRMGNFSGIIVASTLGCTITFTVPVGMGMLGNDARSDFARGILFGLISLPVSLLTGGILCGLTLGETLHQSLPVLFFSILILLGLWKKTALMIRGFSIAARAISILSYIGLMLGAFKFMTGADILPGLAPIEDAMAVVSSIGVVLLGSLPASELLQRALKRPLARLGQKLGLNNSSMAALLIGSVSALPAFALAKEMDKRGRIVVSAFLVCASAALAAHLGFIAGVDPEMLIPLLASKFAGGISAAIIAVCATRKM